MQLKIITSLMIFMSRLVLGFRLKKSCLQYCGYAQSITKQGNVSVLYGFFGEENEKKWNPIKIGARMRELIGNRSIVDLMGINIKNCPLSKEHTPGM